MTFPWFINGAFGLETSLIIAVFLGIGFGFSLERGGFGSSRKLAAQFYFTDMTVFKVMFTAIITAMVGLWGLAKLGMVDISGIWINPTFLWPQIVGGLLLGFGFIISGYCPGTSIVASASGKIDGMLTLVGVVGGIFLFGAVYTPELAAFHTSGDFGRLTLGDVFGMDNALLAFIIAFAAGCLFIVAEMVERIFSKEKIDATEKARNTRLRFAAILPIILFGALFVILSAGSLPEVEASGSAGEIEPVDLATMILEGSEPVMVLDTRTAEEMGEQLLPKAVNVPIADLGDVNYWLNNLPAHKLYVVSDGVEISADDLAIPGSYQVFILKGGFEGWKADVLTKPEQPDVSDSAAMDAFRVHQEIFSYFTGAAVEAPKVSAPPPVVSGGGKKKKAAGGC